jgi:hypothetical protein
MDNKTTWTPKPIKIADTKPKAQVTRAPKWKDVVKANWQEQAVKSVKDSNPNHRNSTNFVEEDVLLREAPSALVSFGASMFSMGRDIKEATEEALQDFAPDDKFKVTDEDIKKYSMQVSLDSDRVKVLKNLRSQAEVDYKLKRWSEKDFREGVAAENPIAGFVGSFADVDAVFAGAGKLAGFGAKAAGYARTGQRIAGALGGAASVAGTYAALGEHSDESTTQKVVNTLLVGGMGGAFAGASKARVIKANGEIIEDTVEHVTKPKPKTQAEELIAADRRAAARAEAQARADAIKGEQSTASFYRKSQDELAKVEAAIAQKTKVVDTVETAAEQASHTEKAVEKATGKVVESSAESSAKALKSNAGIKAAKAQAMRIEMAEVKAAAQKTSAKFYDDIKDVIKSVPDSTLSKAAHEGKHLDAEVLRVIRRELVQSGVPEDLLRKFDAERLSYQKNLGQLNTAIYKAEQRLKRLGAEAAQSKADDVARALEESELGRLNSLEELQAKRTEILAKRHAFERHSETVKKAIQEAELRKAQAEREIQEAAEKQAAENPSGNAPEGHQNPGKGNAAPENPTARPAQPEPSVGDSTDNIRPDSSGAGKQRGVPPEKQAEFDAEMQRQADAADAHEHVDLEFESDVDVEAVRMQSRPAPNNEWAAINRQAEYSTRAKQYLSTTDKLMYFGKNLPAEDYEKLNRLLSDPSFNNPDNAITHASLLQRHGEWRLNALDDALGQAAQEYYGGTGRFAQLLPWNHNSQIKALRAAQKDLSDLRLKLYQAERQAASLGTEVDLSSLIDELAPNKGIASAMHVYIDSGFAKFWEQQLKRTGLLPQDFLEGKGTYMPLQWSYANMRRAMDEGLPEEVLAKFIGDDVLERFPGLASYGRDAESIGKRFIQTQKTSMQATEHMPVGATRDFIAEVLLNSGVEGNKVDSIVDRIMHKQTQQGHKNLRTRNTWDFSKPIVHNGKAYSLVDFVDNDISTQLMSYNRQMAHRAGLMHYGMTVQDVDNLFVKIQDTAPAGHSTAEVRDFLKNVRAQLLGQSVGENTPEFLRSASTAASAWILQNAGIAAIADTSTAIQRLGFWRTAKGMVKNLPSLFHAISKYTPEDAQRLKDVLVGTSTAHERIRYFVTHFEDNHAIPVDTAHNYIAKTGQSIMHLNTSEAIRRFLVNATASAYEDALIAAAKGSKSERAFLMKVGATEADMRKILAEVKKHGTAINKWDADVSLRAQQLLINASDDIALTVKAGEAPAFIEHTSTGKVLFPFMRFAMAGHQKILRKSYNQDGLGGVATLLFWSGAIAPVLAAAKNVTNGKPWDDNIYAGSIQQAPALGYFGIAIDSLVNSEQSRGAAVFSPLQKMNQFFRKVSNPDSELQVYDFTDPTPLLGLTIINQAAGVVKSLENDE